MTRFGFGALGAALALALSLSTSPAAAEDCIPPRILFVVDASSSMLEKIANTSKWDALQNAVAAVLAAYPKAAEYGLMVFPGKAGQCSTGEISVDVAPGTAMSIGDALTAIKIPANNQTPAGQTLVKAASYAPIIAPGHPEYVVFLTDGYQYCAVANNTACATAADCQLMNGANCPTCKPDANDGCYCIQNWPLLGTQALAKKGVKTFVVGFGAAVNVKALNQAAHAGGKELPNCDPNSASPSCYYQASMPNELTAAFSKIVQQVVAEKCVGKCGIEGERTCTLSGWSACAASPTVPCKASCGASGTKTCKNDVLGACSAEAQCGGGGAGGTSSNTAAGGAGGAGGTSSNTAAGGTSGTSSTAPGQNLDPAADSGCGCRLVGAPAGHGAALAALALALAAVRRRRAS